MAVSKCVILGLPGNYEDDLKGIVVWGPSGDSLLKVQTEADKGLTVWQQPRAPLGVAIRRKTGPRLP